MSASHLRSIEYCICPAWWSAPVQQIKHKENTLDMLSRHQITILHLHEIPDCVFLYSKRLHCRYAEAFCMSALLPQTALLLYGIINNPTANAK